MSCACIFRHLQGVEIKMWACGGMEALPLVIYDFFGNTPKRNPWLSFEYTNLAKNVNGWN